MSNQLESALVLALTDTIKWESSVEVDSSGTITVVDPRLPFDQNSYQSRDRQLAFRDLIVGAAVIQASVQVSDVYNYPAIKPQLQGAVGFALPFAGTVAGQLNSQVRHVLHASIPWDAARFADADLYGRDALAYEILARACRAAFENSPLPDIDSTGTVIPSTNAWSLAEATPIQADINPTLALNRDLFKLPDQNLADRDNKIAAYVAQLAQALKNPFQSALRLLVQIESFGTVQREPDVYALISDDGTHRVFQTEPALPNTNQIIYSVGEKTLQWLRDDQDNVHVPQIYAMVIPGIDAGQLIETLPAIPDRKDAQYWRSKAAQLIPTGQSLNSVKVIQYTASGAVTGGYPQVSGASLTVPGQLRISLGSLGFTGVTRVSALIKAQPIVEIAGAMNISNTSGDNGGVDWEIDVASGDIIEKSYIVQGGDGIVYGGNTYLDGMSFAGLSGTNTYTQHGSLTSMVRQYSVAWQLALPPGQWSLKIEYLDLAPNGTGFGIRADYAEAGIAPTQIAKDVVALDASGTLALSRDNLFHVNDTQPFTLNVYWTYGGGQLHVRRLIFESTDNETGQFALSGTIASQAAQAYFIAERYRPDVVKFDFPNQNFSGNTTFILNAGTFADLPLQVQQVEIQVIGTFTQTPQSDNLLGWRNECLNRAVRSVQQSYSIAVSAFGTDVPTFRDSGSNWSPIASENWMSFCETAAPRLREVLQIGANSIAPGRQYEVTASTVVYNGTGYSVGKKFYGLPSVTSFSGGTVKQIGAFMKSSPGDLGRPALVPNGIFFDDTGTTSVKAFYDTPISVPIIASCQPWMIEQGLYVAKTDFWSSDYLPYTLIASAPIGPAAGPPEFNTSDLTFDAVTGAWQTPGDASFGNLNYQFNGLDGTPPYTFAFAAIGDLPLDSTLNSAGLLIVPDALAQGKYLFVARLTDSASLTTTLQCQVRSFPV